MNIEDLQTRLSAKLAIKAANEAIKNAKLVILSVPQIELSTIRGAANPTNLTKLTSIQ